jgi:tetratricopeptide (TPR) repeat protein
MSTRTSPWWPLAVAACAVLVHLGALANGFTLDDVPLVRDNPAIASLSGVPRLLVSPYWVVPGEHYGLYRPLTVVSLALNRAVLGPGPFGFHLVNVLLHAAVAALAWFALRRAGTHYGTALAGGLLFAVHPIHAEAVANVAGRAELLAAAFSIGAWLAHGAGARGRWGAAALYLGAALSKESTLAAPLLFAADDALGEKPRRFTIARYLPYAAAAAVALALRAAALGSHQAAEATIALDNPAAGAGTLPRVLTALWVQVRYLALCVWPRQLSSDYSFDAIPTVRTLADPRALAGLVFAAAFVAALVCGFRRSPVVARSALIWSVFMLASSNLLFPAGTLMAERLAYLPSLGFCLLAGHLGAGLAARGRAARVAAVGASAVAIALLSTRTWARVPAWKDNLTLATTDVATYPRSAKLQAGAGICLEEAGRDAEAETHLRHAVEIDPTYAQMHYNLGVLLARRGATDEAIVHFRRAIELVPDNPMPRRALADLMRRGTPAAP